VTDITNIGHLQEFLKQVVETDRSVAFQQIFRWSQDEAFVCLFVSNFA